MQALDQRGGMSVALLWTCDSAFPHLNQRCDLGLLCVSIAKCNMLHKKKKGCQSGTCDENGESDKGEAESRVLLLRSEYTLSFHKRAKC